MLNTRCRKTAFTLVELLTVIFIISLLIAILVPALGAARNYAKKSSSQQASRSIEAGLELFKNDHGKDFGSTNGYPPSYAHPPIPQANFTATQGMRGMYPFYGEDLIRAYGAHWLPFMLVGADAQGYVSTKTVPNEQRNRPWEWYASPRHEATPISQRSQLYVDPNGVRLVQTGDLPGRPPEDEDNYFPSAMREPMMRLPVLVDAFDQPFLYYAANKFGRPTNMLGEARDLNNDYSGAEQEQGPPYYFHEDNKGFTGWAPEEVHDVKGWDFGNSGGQHPIGVSGSTWTAIKLFEKPRESFAGYILDRKVYKSLKPKKGDSGVTHEVPLRPVNPESYLLFSPGVDGKYGTPDDIGNVPPWED